MEDNNNNQVDKQSGYDQKAFLQIRLHELLLRIDKYNSQPLFYDPFLRCFNYEIVFQNLCSVLQTIYSKLDATEKTNVKTARQTVLTLMATKPVKKYVKDYNLQTIPEFSSENWHLTNDALFKFRCMLEEMMDKHGFNPSKEDTKQSILRM